MTSLQLRYGLGPCSLAVALGCSASPDASRPTLGEALATAHPGDTIQLQDGTYDEQHGETWGYAVPAGVTIRGASSQTVLAGTGQTALLPAGTLSLENLSLAGFDVAVSIAQAGTLSLGDVVIEADRYAVELGACDGCQVHIRDSALTSSSDNSPALFVSDASHDSEVTLEHTSAVGGVFIADAGATLDIDAADLTGNTGSAAINFAGTRLSVTSSTVRAGSAPYGVSLRTGSMTMNDVNLQGSNYGVYQLAGKSTLRRTRLQGYSSIGLYYASGELDLGTATEAGDNSFAHAPDSSGAFGIYVDTGTAPVTCSDTSFDGVLPPAGTVAAGTQDLAEPSQYFLTPGQSIQFFRVH